MLAIDRRNGNYRSIQNVVNKRVYVRLTKVREPCTPYQNHHHLLTVGVTLLMSYYCRLQSNVMSNIKCA